MARLFIALGVLAVLSLACGRQAPRRLELYPTVAALPTQTERVIIWTQTPDATPTPFVLVVSATPNADVFCVSALVAVYLRPSPNSDNYPIVEIPNATQVKDLGGRVGNWYFVALGEKQGWINSEYLELGGCNG